MTAPAVRLSDTAREAVQARAGQIERDGVRSHVENSLLRSYPPAIRENRQDFDRLRGQRLAAAPFSLAAQLRLLATIDLRQDLPRVQAPTLLLSGTHDLDRPPSEVKLAADAIPGSRMVVLASGHFIPQHAPAAFLKEAIDFLG